MAKFRSRRSCIQEFIEIYTEFIMTETSADIYPREFADYRDFIYFWEISSRIMRHFPVASYIPAA